MSYSVNTYGLYPRVTLTWSNSNLNLNYVTIRYYGNAIVGTGSSTNPIISDNQYGTSWTSADLSFNAKYTFILTANNTSLQRIFTIDTTPVIAGSYILNSSTTSSITLQWTGNQSYVRIYRKIISPYITDYVEVSANALIYTSPFYDNDISGNTTYIYKIQPYDISKNIYNFSNDFTITAVPHAPYNITSSYTNNSIEVSFSLPKNSYKTNFYYKLNVTSNNFITSVSGTISPLIITGLSGSTIYNYYIDTYLDNILAATTQNYTLDTNIMTSFNKVYFFDRRKIEYTDTRYSFLSVSVSADKKKMLMCTNSGELVYATSSNGTTWTRSNKYLLTGLGTSIGSRSPGPTVQLAAAGNYGIVVGGKDSSFNPIIINWTGSTPYLYKTVTKYYSSYLHVNRPSTVTYPTLFNSFYQTGMIASSCAISSDGMLISITGPNGGGYYGGYPHWRFYSYNSSNLYRYTTIFGDKSIVYDYGTNSNARITNTGRSTILNFPYGNNSFDAKSIVGLGDGYSGSPCYLFVKTFNSATGINLSTRGALASLNTYSGKITEVPVSDISYVDNYCGCNNCSDGLTYYFPQNDKNIYSITVRCEKNTTPLQIYERAICWYKFNETFGSTITDSNGNFNTTQTNCINDPNGINGYCLNFNNSGYVTLSHLLINNFNGFTISCWIKLNSLGTYIICSKQHDNNNSYGVLSIGCYCDIYGVYNVGTPGIVYFNSQKNTSYAFNGFNPVPPASSTPLKLGVWHHIAVSCNSGNCYIYINGLIETRSTYNFGTINNAPNVTNSYIGYWYANGTQKGTFIDGYINNFAVWDINLTPEAIIELYYYDYNIFSTPASIKGIQLWIDATATSYSTVTSSTFIVNWPDKSMNSCTVSSTFSPMFEYSTTALDGYPGIIDIGGHYQTALFQGIFNNGVTMFVVFKFTIGSSSKQALLTRRSGEGTIAFQVYKTTRMIGNGTNVYSTDLAPDIGLYTSKTIYTATVSSDGSYTEWFNGTSQYSFKGNGFTDKNSGNVSIFGFTRDAANNGGLTVYSNGVISEVIMYNSVLSTSNINNILGYLSSKWDIPITPIPITLPYNAVGAFNLSSTVNYSYIISFMYATTSNTIVFNNDTTASVLIVGGGGCGGTGRTDGGAGGGAGEVKVGTLNFKANVTYTIVVGLNGSSSATPNAPSGTLSSIVGDTINEVALGGGAGGYGFGGSQGNSGGSGGGSTGRTGTTYMPGGYAISGTGTLTSYVNNGGNGTYNFYGGGGGGGAMGPGTPAIYDPSTNIYYSGNGGDGYLWPVTNTIYAAGGAGGVNTNYGNTTNVALGTAGSNGIGGFSGSNAKSYGSGGGGGGGPGGGGTYGSPGIVILAFN